MLDLPRLRTEILSGQCTNLYWGVRSLDTRIPIRPEFSQVFLRLAHAIENLFPDRLSCPVETSFDARIVVIDFCENPKTTPQDMVRVLEDSVDWLAKEDYTS